MDFLNMTIEDLEKKIEEEFNMILDPIVEAKWTTKYINSLPDGAFALVKTVGKDKTGESKKLRALPYKDAGGKVDADHLRNALARWNQVKGFSSEEKAGALKRLRAAASKAGIKTKDKGESLEKITKVNGGSALIVPEELINNSNINIIEELKDTNNKLETELINVNSKYKESLVNTIILYREVLAKLEDKEKELNTLNEIENEKLEEELNTLKEDFNKLESPKLVKEVNDNNKQLDPNDDITVKDCLYALMNPQKGEAIISNKLEKTINKN
jgi:hypothetical protein